MDLTIYESNSSRTVSFSCAIMSEIKRVGETHRLLFSHHDAVQQIEAPNVGAVSTGQACPYKSAEFN